MTRATDAVKLRACVLLLVARIAHGEVLAVSDERLANGLRVVLAPDPSASVVAIHLRFDGDDAGSHLLERLMFLGSLHVKAGELEQRVDAAGGWIGSTTTVDHVSVFEQVPAEALELALWLEAERMASVADAIGDAAVARGKREIAGERRSAYEVEPYALVPRELQRALWPADHPNARPVLGDVATATTAAMRALAKARLTPARATLVIAGRFDARGTRDRVIRYFGSLPRGVAPASAAHATQPLARSEERTVADPIASVVVAFRMPAPFGGDALALEVAARMLAGGRTSRLQRRLVDAGLASSVDAEIVHQREGCELHVRAMPSPGVDVAHVAAEIHDELGKLRTRAQSDDEVRRAATALDSELVIALESVSFRADMLARWAAYTGSPRFFDKQRALLRAVTPRAVQQAAAQWLAHDVTVIAKGAK